MSYSASGRSTAIDKSTESKIENYLDEHPGPNWVSEIADALNIDYSVAFKAVGKLLIEGRIERAKAPVC